MGRAVALGNFDGVHIAHAALIQNMAAYAKEHSLESLAYILEPHPRRVLNPDAPVPLLMPASLKEKRVRAAGADRVLFERRGMEILSLSPEEFVDRILVQELGAAFVTAGFNYRFGKGAAGDATLLSALCSARGITCHILAPMEHGGAPISSTRMRHLLEMGEIEAFNAMSFAPYTILGQVQKGKQLGKTLGFPTLNLEMDAELLLPKKGVYISQTKIDEKRYPGVTNLGQNPTVEKARPRAETYLFGFAEEAYGKTAAVELLAFLRPEQKFKDVSALCMQMQKDTEIAKRYFERKDQDAADTY